MKNEDVEKNAGNTGPAGQEVNAVSYAASLASIDEQNEVTGQRRAGNASIREMVRNASGNRKFPGRDGNGAGEHLYEGYPAGSAV